MEDATAVHDRSLLSSLLTASIDQCIMQAGSLLATPATGVFGESLAHQQFAPSYPRERTNRGRNTLSCCAAVHCSGNHRCPCLEGERASTGSKFEWPGNDRMDGCHSHTRIVLHLGPTAEAPRDSTCDVQVAVDDAVSLFEAVKRGAGHPARGVLKYLGAVLAALRSGGIMVNPLPHL